MDAAAKTVAASLAFLLLALLVFAASCASAPASVTLTTGQAVTSATSNAFPTDGGRVFADEDGAEWEDGVTNDGERIVTIAARGRAGEGILVLVALGDAWQKCGKLSIVSELGEVDYVDAAVAPIELAAGAEVLEIYLGPRGLAKLAMSEAVAIGLCDSVIVMSADVGRSLKSWAGMCFEIGPALSGSLAPKGT
jgi:hypothetical protein